MRNTLRLLGTALLLSSLAGRAADIPAAAAGRQLPPAAKVIPVTETLWGRKVTDNYRYMETLDPSTIEWMEAQSAYTRSILDAIPRRAALEAKIATFTGSFGFTQGYVNYGGRAFYEERTPGSDNFDLVVADKAGKRKIVDVAALRAANGGKPFAINYFLASPDGVKVAVGISEGGSEDAVLSVYDAAGGNKIAGPIDRAQFGATSWSGDSKILYFVRLQKLEATAPPTDKYKNATADSWDLKSEPVALLGAGVGHGPEFLPTEFPAITVSVGAPLATALSINGVQNELAMWTAPAANLSNPKVAWTKFITRDDGVTGADMRGSDIFLLSHHDAPTFKVLLVRAGRPLSSATVLVPARPDRVIEGIHAASDALYVLARHGAYSQLLRIPTGTTHIEEVALPFEGHIDEAFSDPRIPGAAIQLSSWVVPSGMYAYLPANKSFSDLKIGAHGDMSSSNYAIGDLSAKAQDGVMVPLSLVQ